VVKMVAGAAVFLGVFLLLQLSWQGLRGTWAERLVVQDLDVRSTVMVVNVVTPEVQARANGFTVSARGGGLNILNGCDGTEVWFLLLAAFVAAPLPFKSKVSGMLVGTMITFAVNELRILALFYAHRMDQSLFDMLHATVTPIATVLLVSGFFYVWLTHGSTHATASH
jgi:exosortase/archaeosortase family protein